MTDLIRKSDALAVVLLGGSPVGMSNRIDALPAVAFDELMPFLKTANEASREQLIVLCTNILAALEPVAAPDLALHVNKTLKAEHDADNTLTDPAAIREAALREAAEAINERGAREQEDFGLTRATQNFFRARDLVRSLITKGDTDDR